MLKIYCRPNCRFELKSVLRHGVSSLVFISATFLVGCTSQSQEQAAYDVCAYSDIYRKDFAKLKPYKSLVGGDESCFWGHGYATQEAANEAAMSLCNSKSSYCSVFAEQFGLTPWADVIASNGGTIDKPMGWDDALEGWDDALIAVLGGAMLGMSMINAQEGGTPAMLPTYMYADMFEDESSNKAVTLEHDSSNQNSQFKHAVASQDCEPVPPACQRASERGIAMVEQFQFTDGISNNAYLGYCMSIIGEEVNRYCADQYEKAGKHHCSALSVRQAEEYARAIPQYLATFEASKAVGVKMKCSL